MDKLCRKKDCNYFFELQNTDDCNYGICSFQDYFVMVDLNKACPFQVKIDKNTCGQCEHFNNDNACMTCEANDTFAERCDAFINSDEVAFKDSLHKLFYSGKLTGDKIKEYCEYIKNIKEILPYFDQQGIVHNKEDGK